MTAEAKLIECEKKDDALIIRFVEKEMGVNFDAERLSRELREAIAGVDRPLVVLNLEDVAYICSRVIASLIGFHREVWKAGGEVKLCQVGDYVRETFRAAKLHHIMDMYPTEEEALAALQD